MGSGLTPLGKDTITVIVSLLAGTAGPNAMPTLAPGRWRVTDLSNLFVGWITFNNDNVPPDVIAAGLSKDPVESVQVFKGIVVIPATTPNVKLVEFDVLPGDKVYITASAASGNSRLVFERLCPA